MPSAEIIDGRELAKQLLSELKSKIAEGNYSRAPGLATILVGNDPASAIYVANKRKRAKSVGIKSFHFDLPKNAHENSLLDLIGQLNNDPQVDGILVQLPLPKLMREKCVIEAINAKKDVDGFHPLNIGYLVRGDPQVVACTPLGIMHMLKSIKYNLAGKHAVVVGRSNIVGKPVAHLLLQQNATITICHSRTQDLASITKSADVVVAAVGKAKLIKRSHIKPGAVVIDVGMNRDENDRLCGDVDFDDVVEIASHITPVPGGVGPLTIAMLLRNTLDNFLRNKNEH